MQLDVCFRRHLIVEQRGAILEALRSEIDPDATVGDVLDAAETVGFGDTMGEFSLQDLADALLGAASHESRRDPPDDLEVESSDDLDDLDNLDDESGAGILRVTDPKAAGVPSHRTKTATKKTAAKKTATKKTAAKKTATKKTAAKKTATKKTAAKKDSISSATRSTKESTHGRGHGAARKKALRRKLDADEPMSLDEAAELLVPIIADLEEATMQNLEETTGIGRRKLRFHIGQLVRHEYLERHGMGRGTYYSAV